MVHTMQIGSLLGINNIKAASPRLPDKNASLEAAFANIASTSSPGEGNRPAKAGCSPFSSGMTAEFLKTQEYEDETSVESQFKEMLSGGSPEDMLSEITSMSGYMKWQIKELTKKIAGEVMGSMGVTMDDINAMPVEQKTAIMQRIMDAVRQKLQTAMEEQMKKEGKNPLLSLGTINIPQPDIA
mgnify:CR=1 FL=1